MTGKKQRKIWVARTYSGTFGDRIVIFMDKPGCWGEGVISNEGNLGEIDFYINKKLGLKRGEFREFREVKC